MRAGILARMAIRPPYGGRAGASGGGTLPDAPATDGGALASVGGTWTASGFGGGNVEITWDGARDRWSGHVTFPAQARHLDTVLDVTVAGAQHGDDTSAVLDADFTAGGKTFRFWRIFYDADDARLAVNIGTAANPVPNPAGVLLRDYLLSITNTAGVERTYHLREADFEPEDSAGSTHEWEFYGVPADLISRLTNNEIKLYKPVVEGNYVPSATASDDVGDVLELDASKAPAWVHPHAATVRTYADRGPDAGHDLKAVILEEAAPKAATATYEALSAGGDWEASVRVAPDYSGQLRLATPATSDANKGRWTLTLGGGAGTTAVAVWGQDISALRLRFTDGTTFGGWLEYAVERDSTISNALAYRTTSTGLDTPAQWGSPSDGSAGAFEWNLVLADGTLAYPEAEHITQRAMTPAQMQAWLSVPGRYVQGASVAGQTLTLSDDSTVVLNASLSPAGTGITEAQVRTLIAAIAGAVDFSVAGAVITATLAAASVGAGNLDAATEAKRRALRDAIGAGTGSGSVPSGDAFPVAPQAGQKYELTAQVTQAGFGVLSAATIDATSIGWYAGRGGAITPAPAGVDATFYQTSTTKIVVLRTLSQALTAIRINGTRHALTNRAGRIFETAAGATPFLAGQRYKIEYEINPAAYADVVYPVGEYIYLDSVRGWHELSLTIAGVDSRIQAPARAGNTDPWPDAKLGVRDMTAAAYVALSADQRGGTIYVSG